MLNSPISSPDRFIHAGRRTAVTAPRPYLDAIIFMLLPTIWNIPNVQQFALPRILVSMILIAFLLKNVFVYSAISTAWAKKVNGAFVEVFTRANKCLLPTVMLLLLIMVAEMRGTFLGTSGVFSFVGSFLWSFAVLFYVASVVTLNKSVESRRWLMVAFVGGLGLYVAANLVGHAAGLSGALVISEAGQNKILSVLGIGMNRIAFPFAGGLNNFGVMAGLTAVSGAMLVIFGRGLGMRAIGLTVAILGFSGAVLTDSRAAVGIAVTVIAVMPLVLLSKRLTQPLKWLPLATLAAPFVLVGVYALIQGTALADLVGREGDFAQRLGALSGRDAVWAAAFDVLKSPQPMHFIGYGAQGQYTSGASQDYAWVFLQLSSRSSQSLHNAYLQTIFDIGYIGLVILLVLWMRLMSLLISAVSAVRQPETVIPLAMAVFILLAGVLEICGTPSFPDSFGVLLFLVAWTLPIRSPDQSRTASARGPKRARVIS